MKKIKIWAIVDKNRYLLDIHSASHMPHAQEIFAKKLRQEYGTLVVSTQLHEKLTGVAFPFLDHKMIVVPEEELYEKLFQETEESIEEELLNPSTLFLIGDEALFGPVFERFQDEVDEVFLIQIQNELGSEAPFPFLDEDHWKKMDAQDFPEDSDTLYHFKFVHYVNTRPKSLS